MEIDPNTDFMWIIDVGRININEPHPNNKCPPKLVIYDMKRDSVIRVHVFPPDVVSRQSSFMNDIVLDYVDGRASFAYITDTNDAKMYVYDFEQDISYFYSDKESMNARSSESNFTRGSNQLSVTATLDGIAMSPDFQFVYYCALSQFALYRISTSTLRKSNQEFRPTLVGIKNGQTDGMVFTMSNLYYGTLLSDSVYSMAYHVKLPPQFSAKLLFNKHKMSRWVDTFAVDSEGSLWFVANNLDLFFGNSMNFTVGNDNINIWKVHINEHGYLWNAGERTTIKHTSNSGKLVSANLFFTLSILCNAITWY